MSKKKDQILYTIDVDLFESGKAEGRVSGVANGTAGNLLTIVDGDFGGYIWVCQEKKECLKLIAFLNHISYNDHINHYD